MRVPSSSCRRAARLDPARRFRYTLTRRWGPGQACCFIMLNPSAADELRDDPTIRRCIGFARTWGFPALEVVNLFAWRTHEPRRLMSVPDPVGAWNDKAIAGAVGRAGCVVCAWGAALQESWPLARERAEAAWRIVVAGGVEPCSLGATQRGHPRHPLYLPAETQPAPFAQDGAGRLCRIRRTIQMPR